MPSLKIDIIVDDKGRPVINQVTGSMKELAAATNQADAAARAHGGATKSADSSMAGLARSVLRLYAAYYVVSPGIQGVTGLLMQGVKAIDDYNLSIAKMAAMMTGMMEPNGKGLAQQYQDAYAYAKQLNVMIEQVDKNTLLNAMDLRQITEEMLKQGVVVDTNNKKQVEAFTNISNALAVIAAGAPNKEIQLRQEIRALLQGELRDTDQLAKMLNAQTGDLKNQIALHRQQGDLIEWLGEQLRGFAAAQGDINSSWEAMRTSLETIYNQVLRAGFKSAFADITGSARGLSDWATQHKAQIAEILEKGYVYVKIVFYDIKNLAMDVWSIMKGYEPLLRTFGGLALTVADRFGDIYAALKPIAQITGTILQGWLEIASAIVRFNPAVLAARMAVEGPGAIWQDVKDTYGRGKDIAATLKSYKMADIPNRMKAEVAARRAYRDELLENLVGSSYDIEGWGGGGKNFKLKPPAPDDKTKNAAEQWAKTIADLRTEIQKANPEIDEFDKKLLDMANKFADLYAQGAKNKQPTGMLEGLKSEFIDEILKQKIVAEEQAQHEISMIQLKGFNERFNIEKDNAIKIAQLKAQWGEMSERAVIEMQNDLLMENLDYQASVIEAEMGRIVLLPDTLKNQKELAKLNNDMLKIDTQRRTSRELMAVQIANLERQALDTQLNMISSIRGMENEAHILRLRQIETEGQKYLAAGVPAAAVKAWQEYQTQLAAIQKSINSTTSTFWEGMKAGAQQYYLQMKSSGQFGAQVFDDTTSSIKGSLTSLFNDMTKDELDWKGWFINFTQGLASAWNNMLAEMLTNWIMTGELMKKSSATSSSGGLLGLLTGLLGSSSSYSYDAGASYGVSGWEASLGYHGGGVVGYDTPAFTRPVPASVFASAPRFHKGNEYAAILEEGEGVFTKNQMKALGTGGKANITVVNINAVDIQSFADAVKRNPAAIVNVVNSSLKNNAFGLRSTMKRTR